MIVFGWDGDGALGVAIVIGYETLHLFFILLFYFCAWVSLMEGYKICNSYRNDVVSGQNDGLWSMHEPVKEESAQRVHWTNMIKKSKFTT
jgi:hypothetical protein